MCSRDIGAQMGVIRRDSVPECEAEPARLVVPAALSCRSCRVCPCLVIPAGCQGELIHPMVRAVRTKYSYCMGNDAWNVRPRVDSTSY